MSLSQSRAEIRISFAALPKPKPKTRQARAGGFHLRVPRVDGSMSIGRTVLSECTMPEAPARRTGHHAPNDARPNAGLQLTRARTCRLGAASSRAPTS